MALQGLLGLIKTSPDKASRDSEGQQSRSRQALGARRIPGQSSLSSLILAGDPREQNLSESDQEGLNNLDPESDRPNFGGMDKPLQGAHFPLQGWVPGFSQRHDRSPAGLPGGHDQGLFHGYDPDERQGQDGGYANLSWWANSLGENPLAGVGEAWNKFKGWVSPSKRRKTNPSEPPELELPAPTKSTRPELQTLKKGNGKNSHKDKLAKALVSARMLKNRQLKAPSIEKDFYAASSKGAKDAKKRTIDKLLTALTEPGPSLPLTVDTLKGLASALMDGGYKAGEGYVVEAKLWHVEEGHPWTDQLDRVFKQCKRALCRGQGPRKKAAEVGWDRRHNPFRLNFNKSEKAVKFGAQLFLFSVIWMLREIELALLSTEDLVMDHLSKRVTMNLRLSKMDAEGKGVRRTLQCLCKSNSCSKECPYLVSKNLVEMVERFNGTNSPLALTKRRVLATKAQLVKTWRDLFGKEVSGHSGRRTGALNYIRSGWSITQVAHLGRWKSGAILAYAEEALEQLPANLNIMGPTLDHKGSQVLIDRPISEEELAEWKAQLRKEMDALKEDVERKDVETEENINYWVNFYKENPGTLPQKVQSLPGKTVHMNLARSAASPPISWRTACGWSFYGSKFVFADPGQEITCQKCLALCAKQ